MTRHAWALLAGLALLGAGPAVLAGEARPPAGPAARDAAAVPAVEAAPAAPAAPAPPGMVSIPAGVYRPPYRRSVADRPEASRGPPAEETVPVAAFFLDAYPVTNAEYLAFVQARPRWRRSRVPRLFADVRYLDAWSGDLEPGARAPARSPVVDVSWFAARAFCKWRGAGLPTTAQWERAAAAGERADTGRYDAAFAQRILEWYARPTPPVLPAVGGVYRNVWGAYDLHGLVWEWVDDFNTALVTGESRGDSGLERTLFCAAGSVGSVNPQDYASFMRYGFRSSLRGNYSVPNLGFRCAQAAPAGGS
jgi:formylglycine-generating enzyme required for sulfatase activity